MCRESFGTFAEAAVCLCDVTADALTPWFFCL